MIVMDARIVAHRAVLQSDMLSRRGFVRIGANDAFTKRTEMLILETMRKLIDLACGDVFIDSFGTVRGEKAPSDSFQSNLHALAVRESAGHVADICFVANCIFAISMASQRNAAAAGLKTHEAVKEVQLLHNRAEIHMGLVLRQSQPRSGALHLFRDTISRKYGADMYLMSETHAKMIVAAAELNRVCRV